MEKTVFVVDDVDSNLMIVKNALKDAFRVITIGSAEKLFSLLLAKKPDLILLDIEMPGIDGFQVLNWLKKDRRYDNIPVIFVTSGGSAANVARAAVYGACDFIVKPFDPVLLRKKVEHHIFRTSRIIL